MAVHAFTAPAHGRAVTGARHGNYRSRKEAPLLDLCTGDPVI
jgi:hypothetical protein